MRLTNAKREAILKYEIKQKFHDKKNELHKNIIDFLDKEASKQVEEKVTNSGLVEEGYINTCSTVRLTSEDRNEIEDLTIIINDSRRFYNGSIGIYNSYPCKRFQSDFNVKITKTLKNKISKYKKIKEDEREFESKLNRILHSYTTSKKLIEVLPELEIHFKDEKRTNALVPFNEISEMQKLLSR